MQGACRVAVVGILAGRLERTALTQAEFLEAVELSRTLPFHRAGGLLCYLDIPESHHHVKQLHG